MQEPYKRLKRPLGDTGPTQKFKNCHDGDAIDDEMIALTF